MNIKELNSENYGKSIRYMDVDDEEEAQLLVITFDDGTGLMISASYSNDQREGYLEVEHYKVIKKAVELYL